MLWSTMRLVGGAAWRGSRMVRNTRYFAGEAKESYAVRGTLAQLSDTLTSEVNRDRFREVHNLTRICRKAVTEG